MCVVHLFPYNVAQRFTAVNHNNRKKEKYFPFCGQPVYTDFMSKTKTKPSGGRHKTPRVAVQIPQQFAAVLRDMAAQSRQPTLWVLIEIISAEAKRRGVDCPALPWGEKE